MFTNTALSYDSDTPRRPIIGEVTNLWRYRRLIYLLVGRDLTLRYKRSVLGVWWTLLNPLLTSLVLWIIFSNIFGRGQVEGAPFSVYLLSGILFVGFFQQGVNAAGSAILGARAVLVKVYVPAEVFSVSSAVAAGVNLLLSLVPLFFVQLATGTGIPWTAALVWIPGLLLLLLVAGVGLIVASLAVHFYDILDFVKVLTQMLAYLVPTFYPLDIVPESLQLIIKMNPLYSYLTVFRSMVYGGSFGDPWMYAVMIVSSLFFFSLGTWIFSRSWRNVAAVL